MLDAVRVAVRVANTTAGVLIRGESGTGKELLARFLHERSRRRAGPFVAVNCAALTLQCLERELFGRVAGVFPGDPSALVGKVEQASGGTLFIDEVAAMSAVTQVKLLRALEERVVEPYGGDDVVCVDVRVIAATDRELEEEVAAGRFREDLYYRLAVIPLTLPPLRERGDDVRMLAEHFIGSFACANDRNALAIAEETLALLRSHPWPGNVRQLKETLECAAATAGGPILIPTDLPAAARDLSRTFVRSGADGHDVMPLDELERLHIQRVVAMAGGHLDHAAELLGIGRLVLQRKLREHRAH